MILKLLYEDSPFIFITLEHMIMSPYIVGFFEPRNYFTILFVLILNFMCLGKVFHFSFLLVLVVFIYKRIKEKKNLNWIANIGIYSQISMVFSSSLYYLLYNTVNLITFEDSVTTQSKEMVVLSITANVIYSLITILLISYFKDVVFALIMLIYQTGYTISVITGNRSEDDYFTRELITCVVVFCIIAVMIITTVLKYGFVAFGYEVNDEIDFLLDKIRRKEFERNNNDF